jgi:hypothetical protein
MIERCNVPTIAPIQKMAEANMQWKAKPENNSTNYQFL